MHWPVTVSLGLLTGSVMASLIAAVCAVREVERTRMWCAATAYAMGFFTIAGLTGWMLAHARGITGLALPLFVSYGAFTLLLACGFIALRTPWRGQPSRGLTCSSGSEETMSEASVVRSRRGDRIRQMHWSLDVGRSASGVIEQVDQLADAVQSVLTNSQQQAVHGGFEQALHARVNDICARTGRSISIHVDETAAQCLNDRQCAVLLQIVAIMLNRTFVRATASRGDVSLVALPGFLRLTVTVNGCVPDGRSDVRQIEEFREVYVRSEEIDGQLKIESQPDTGMRVQLDLPRHDEYVP